LIEGQIKGCVLITHKEVIVMNSELYAAALMADEAFSKALEAKVWTERW
jgi:hypothetical protein